jgi:hypothetical protein
MSGSSAEREIRDAVVARIGRDMPDARVIHELVVHDCRADIAAVQRERVTLFEIKSEKDRLSRLKRQVSRFEDASHETIVVAHARWFEEFDYNSGGRGFRPAGDLVGLRHVWRYPEPQAGEFVVHWPWRFDAPSINQPHARRFLQLLWKAELLQEAHRHRIVTSSRSAISAISGSMAYLMTGQEIAKAVCRQLRGRPFPEADDPIIEPVAEMVGI